MAHQQSYCRTLFSRCILILRFLNIDNSLHFNLVDFPVNFIKQFVPGICRIYTAVGCLTFLYFTNNTAYHILKMLLFSADKVLMMGHCGNLHVFNFVILTIRENREIRHTQNIHVYSIPS